MEEGSFRPSHPLPLRFTSKRGAEKAADAEAPKSSKSKGAAKAAKSRDAELRELEALISDIQKATGNGSVAVTPCGPPSPRLNCSLTAVSSDEVVLFGGEFYDGNPVNTFVYNELFRWHLGRQEWSQVATANTPPPRCSHQATAKLTMKLTPRMTRVSLIWACSAISRGRF